MSLNLDRRLTLRTMMIDLTLTAPETSALSAAQAGDEQAFSRLVEPYRRALTIHGYRMLGSRYDTEDVVQETLLRAWRGLASYEPRASFGSWLYRIATNACLDDQRRPRRARQTVERRAPESDPAQPDRAERELVGRYVKAFEADDIEGLIALLREDATLRMPPQRSVLGAVAIARFFRETVAGGDLRRIRLTPIRANGRPAVEIQLVADDGRLVPHGLSLLEIRDNRIAGIDAFPQADCRLALDRAAHSP